MARISPGTMTAAIFAILVGLAGAYGVRQYLRPVPQQAPSEEQPAPPEMVYVPVAGRDLIAGQTLTMTDLIVRKFTREQYAESEFAGQAFMSEPEQIIGQTLRKALPRGSTFVPASFYPENMGPGIAEYLKPGYRAVTVPIENIGAVEGFARPGTRVDVLYRTWKEEHLPEVTVTLLEDVEVLAVGRAAVPGQRVRVGDRRSSRKGSVTLAATPTQAKALKVAEGRGELSLTLRNPRDDQDLVPVMKQSEPMTLRRLLGLKQGRRKQMEIYRGADRQVLEFGGGDEPVFEIGSERGITTPVAADRAARPQPESQSRVAQDAGS